MNAKNLHTALTAHNDTRHLVLHVLPLQGEKFYVRVIGKTEVIRVKITVGDSIQYVAETTKKGDVAGTAKDLNELKSFLMKL